MPFRVTGMRPGNPRFSLGALIGAIVIATLVIGAAYLHAIGRVQAVQLPTHITVSICGNGLIEYEVCDDGTANNHGEYGSSTAERHCNPDCHSFGPYCGDGTLQ